MLRTIYRTIYIIMVWLHKLTSKVDKNILVFSSFPEYADNSRALSEYLEPLDRFKIYWLVNNKKEFQKRYPNSRVRFIQLSEWYGFKNLRILIRAGWFFSTHGFWHIDTAVRREDQRYIYVWHGCGLKDVDSSAKQHHGQLLFDTIFLAGPFFRKYMAPKWFWPQEIVLDKGFPRYDWLLHKDTNALELKRHLSVKEDGKVVIWMPTYRNHVLGIFNDNDDIKSFPLLYNNEMWRSLDAFCHKLGVVLVVKLHPMQKDYDIDWMSFTNIKQISDQEINEANTKLYSLLAVTDGLITDYSSVAVDYLLVDKPIGFTLDDFCLYDAGRGFIVDNPKDYMPGHHMYNLQDLEMFLLDIVNNKDTMKEKRASFAGVLYYKSNNYCKEIAESIGLL